VTWSRSSAGPTSSQFADGAIAEARIRNTSPTVVSRLRFECREKEEFLDGINKMNRMYERKRN
jgi:hypothetical protein